LINKTRHQQRSKVNKLNLSPESIFEDTINDEAYNSQEEKSDEDDDGEIELPPLGQKTLINALRTNKSNKRVVSSIRATSTGRKRLASEIPNYNLPKWSDWETCNSKLHGIFGYSSDFNNFTPTMKKNLLNTIKQKYNVTSANVGLFFDDLIEKPKESMETDEDSKSMYTIWVEIVDVLQEKMG
jgi:hypothetical protein